MKRDSRIFLFLFAFFIIVAACALFLLKDVSSVFNRSKDSYGAETAVLTQNIVGEEQETVAEPEPEPEPEAETVTEAEPEPEPEPAPEPEPEPEPESQPEIRYFTYTINTSRLNLRLREEPSTNAKILDSLKKKSTGYIIKPGNEWCKVVTDKGKEGYVSTEYLEIMEVTKEAFPEDAASKVEASDEELSAAFNS